MRFFKHVLLLLPGLLYLPGLYAQQGPRPNQYVCMSTENAILIDGEMEPAWEKAAWTEAFQDIRGDNMPSPLWSTRMKMLWDSSHLYLFAELEEPHLWGTMTTRDDTIWFDNDFEVFLDPEGDGIHYFELEINALGTEFDLFLPKPYNQGGIADIGWDIEGLDVALSLQGSLNDPRDVDSGWTLEIAIPWQSLSHPLQQAVFPRAGDTWRMNFSRVQWHLQATDSGYVKKTDPTNGKTLPEENWVWSPQGVINMHIPEHWGFVQFAKSLATTKKSRTMEKQ